MIVIAGQIVPVLNSQWGVLSPGGVLWIWTACVALGVGCTASSSPRFQVTSPNETPTIKRTTKRDTFLTDSQIAAAMSQSHERWFGLYLEGKKVGFSRTALRRSKGRFIVASTFSMSVTGLAGLDGGNIPVANHVYDQLREYQAVAPYRLMVVVDQVTTSEGIVKKVATRRANHMEVAVSTDGKMDSRRRAPLSQETARSFAEAMTVDPNLLRKGQRSKSNSFWIDKLQDVPSVMTVQSVHKEWIGGVRVTVAEIEKIEAERRYLTKLVTPGIPIEAQVGGLRMRLETRDRAKRNVRGFDLLDDGVRVRTPIGDPTRVDMLMVEVVAPEGVQLPRAINQDVVAVGDNRYRVTIRSGLGDRVSQTERVRGLRVTPNLDFDHPAIVALAARISAGSKHPSEQVPRFVRWLHRSMKPTLGLGTVIASQLVRNPRGDCTEFALLLTALLRAQGIAARQVSGLVYLGDEYRRFGWHTWVEVEIHGRWMPVDASWNEAVANATHLKLANDADAGIGAAVGALDIRVLNYTTGLRP